ncbi:hypothetical protein TSUD_127520 [Trifolium subterraneum]|nr:hypothetical protein TSUD_127520 [Trifolium subterraneum]
MEGLDQYWTASGKNLAGEDPPSIKTEIILQNKPDFLGNGVRGDSKQYCPLPNITPVLSYCK